MPLTNVRAKAGKASEKVAKLVRKARANKGECVLVVYEQQEANIYYEGNSEQTKTGSRSS